MNPRRFSPVIFCAFATFFFACAATAKIQPVSPEPSQNVSIQKDDNPNLTKKFSEIWVHITRRHVSGVQDTPPARRACEMKMIHGGISECLDDPNSEYLSAEDLALSDADIYETFGGIGLELTTYHNLIIVMAPIHGTPAGDSGAFATGDVVYEVNGEDVSGRSLLYVVQKIRGPVGTEVAIRVKRRGKVLDPVTLVRQKITTEPIETATIGDDIIYIKTQIFSVSFGGEYIKAVASAFARGADGILDINKPEKGVIIDLRNNPGGLLNVIYYLSYFYAPDEESTVVTLKSRDREIPIPVRAIIEGFRERKSPVPPGVLRNIPHVLLINEGSASASEILAGLLRDWNGFTLIGTKTFGKGSVQTIIPLADKDALKLTVEEYFVGNSKVKINKLGLEPDIWVESSEQKFDPNKSKPPLVDIEHDEVLKRAVEFLRNQAPAGAMQNR